MRFSTNMKQILTLSLAIIPLLSWAYDTEVDGFAYNLNEKTKEAEVTYGWNNYVGDVVIPSSMTFEGITYSVTSIVSSPEITCPFPHRSFEFVSPFILNEATRRLSLLQRNNRTINI